MSDVAKLVGHDKPPCARDRCGHEWDDHNHEGEGLTALPDEDCCTVRGCDCEVFLPENL